MDSNIKWTEAKIDLRQQVVALDAAIRKKKDQDAELNARFITWWELLLRRYGAHLARFLDAYKTEPLTVFNSIHEEELDWHPSRIEIQETDVVGTWWLVELYYPNLGVEVTVSLSVKKGQKLNEEGIKLHGFDIRLDMRLSEEDKAIKQVVEEALKKEEEASIARLGANKAFQAWWAAYLKKYEREVVRMLNVAAGLESAFPTNDPQVVTTMARTGDATGVRVFEIQFKRLGFIAWVRTESLFNKMIEASDIILPVNYERLEG